MAVAICAALDRFTGAGKSKEDWIHISRDAEAIVINVPTGTQDHYPPAFGGAAAIELPPGGEHRVELRVNLDELERRVVVRSEEHTSELQSRRDLVCRLLLEKKNT